MFEPSAAHHFQGTKIGNILERQHIQGKRKRRGLRTSLLEGSGMDQIMEHLLRMSRSREGGKAGL